MIARIIVLIYATVLLVALIDQAVAYLPWWPL